MSTLTPRRRVTRVVAGLLALGLVGALSLQACGSSGSSSSSDTTTADGSTTTTVVNTTSLDGVTVEGDFGSKPTVTFDPSYVGTEDSSKVLIEGDGPVVTADQRVTADYLGVGGADGTELGGDLRLQAGQLLHGRQEPATGDRRRHGREEGREPGRDRRRRDRQRRPVEHRRLRHPRRADDPDERRGRGRRPRPGAARRDGRERRAHHRHPGGDAPTALVVQPLIKGAGPEVTAGQTLTVQYVGMVWANGTVFDSSWSRGAPVEFADRCGPADPGLRRGPRGPDRRLPGDAGHPARQGLRRRPATPQAGISGTDTLVFVVDILAAA